MKQPLIVLACKYNFSFSSFSNYEFLIKQKAKPKQSQHDKRKLHYKCHRQNSVRTGISISKKHATSIFKGLTCFLLLYSVLEGYAHPLSTSVREVGPFLVQ